MPSSPEEEPRDIGGPDLVSIADMPQKLEAAGLQRLSVQRIRQLAEDDPNWPTPRDQAQKYGRMRLYDWRLIEPYFRTRVSRQGKRTDLPPKPASE